MVVVRGAWKRGGAETAERRERRQAEEMTRGKETRASRERTRRRRVPWQGQGARDRGAAGAVEACALGVAPRVPAESTSCAGAAHGGRGVRPAAPRCRPKPPPPPPAAARVRRRRRSRRRGRAGSRQRRPTRATRAAARPRPPRIPPHLRSRPSTPPHPQYNPLLESQPLHSKHAPAPAAAPHGPSAGQGARQPLLRVHRPPRPFLRPATTPTLTADPRPPSPPSQHLLLPRQQHRRSGARRPLMRLPEDYSEMEGAG